MSYLFRNVSPAEEKKTSMLPNANANLKVSVKTKGRVKGKNKKPKNQTLASLANVKDKTWAIAGSPIPYHTVRVDNYVHNYVQQFESLAVITTSGAAAQFYAAAFDASVNPQFSSFATLYDQYRIARIIAYVRPRLNSGSVPASQGNSTVVAVVDYDDANALTSMNAAFSYENLTLGDTSHGIVKNIVPHTAGVAATTTGPGNYTANTNISNQWIDVVSTTAKWFGLKLAADINSNGIVIDIYYQIHWQFRNLL